VDQGRCQLNVGLAFQKVEDGRRGAECAESSFPPRIRTGDVRVLVLVQNADSGCLFPAKRELLLQIAGMV